ncbi:unnamed protein product [Lactuca saligna]|uniref:60S ribosomal protein L7a n=1 Tax=Lactuca saligna TaxID=75948 RepID=A0AA35YA18_LACSI|nr:unnamed protein product [Lactuca saligna]
MSSTFLTYASTLIGSLSRSTTPEPQIVARLTNPRIPAAGGRVNSAPSEHSDLAAGMILSVDGLINQENEIDEQNTHIKHPYLTNKGPSDHTTCVIVHQKAATAMCLTTVKNEDKMEFSRILEAIKENFNDKYNEYRKKWGGGIMGSKSQAKTKAKERVLVKEAAQRLT